MNLITKVVCSISIVLISFAAYAEEADVNELEKKALAGDVKAQFKLGAMYDFGRGVDRSYENAEKWYLMAANNGYAEAQNSLGSAYQAEKRYDEARKWYEKAAKQEHPMAINSLGFLYDLGLGVPQNRQKGFELYSKAADLGWAEAMWNIANMYGAGQLGEKDLYKACVWTVRAKNYSAPSQNELKNQLNNILAKLPNILGSDRFSACEGEAEKWSPKK